MNLLATGLATGFTAEWATGAATAPALGTATGASPADLLAARSQMAFTLGFHIILASIGVGLPALTALAEWRALRTGDHTYRELAHRWAKAAGVLFAVGAVSGTVLSFEMGTLWPSFMGTYGQVFGAGFAMEGIAFFIEAIFIGIYLYGWDRLPPKAHLLTAIPIVISGLLSAFFVVTVNAWMNQPRGFRLVEGPDGKPVVTDVKPLAAMFNPATPTQATHLILASLMLCGFVVASVYAVPLLRGSRDRYHRLGFAIPFTMAAALAPIQVIVGDWAVRFVADNQPVKFAAMEGVEHTEAGVPFRAGPLEIPHALSLMLRFDPDATLRGLDSYPADVRPPDPVVHVAFQIMAGIGTALLGLAAWAAIVWWRRRDLPRSPWFYRAAIPAGVGAVIALEAGWTVTEVGRQPWIVYGVMRTSEAVNPSGGLRYGLYVVLAVYAVLGAATVAVLRRMRHTPGEPALAEGTAPDHGPEPDPDPDPDNASGARPDNDSGGRPDNDSGAGPDNDSGVGPDTDDDTDRTGQEVPV